MSVPKDHYPVHQSHCCLLHGCKYGDDDCPVSNGIIVQEFLCETCDDYGIESVEQIRRVLNGEIPVCRRCGCLNPTGQKTKNPDTQNMNHTDPMDFYGIDHSAEPGEEQPPLTRNVSQAAQAPEKPMTFWEYVGVVFAIAVAGAVIATMVLN